MIPSAQPPSTHSQTGCGPSLADMIYTAGTVPSSSTPTNPPRSTLQRLTATTMTATREAPP